MKLYEEYRNNATTINQDEVKRLDRPFTPLGRIISLLFMMLCIFALWRFTARAGEWYLLGGLMFLYLVLKEAFALFYRPSKRELTKDYKVTAIVTCYNEDPDSVVSVFDNILALDYPVHEILFLDDGSADPLAYEVAKSFAEDHKDVSGVPKFQIVRFEKNRGKRTVMMDGFQRATGDYVFLLDSDSEILPNALTELLRPFEDGKTTSCVGNIGILNEKENFLTKMQSLTYYNAFQMGRSAQSVTGSVVICSGAFSVHKKDFILANLEKFEEDVLFGITVSSGDDRALTALSQKSGGKTRYQSTAYCATKVPATWRKFQSQRRRWQRSGYVCSLKTIKDVFPQRLGYLFWVFAEAYFWLIATVIFALAVLMRGFYFDLIDVILYHVIIMYKKYSFYLLYRPLHFLLVPIYTFVYGLSLTYTRIHAALTLKNDGWGTRAVESERVEQMIAEAQGEEMSVAA